MAGQKNKTNKRGQKPKDNASNEGGNNPPPPNQQKHPPQQKQKKPTNSAAQSLQSAADELEVLRQQVKRLTEERTASSEAAKSLEETNKSLEARLVEFETGNGVQATQPKAKKKKLIRRPKGQNWKLIDGMHLANDPEKYRRIIQKLKNLKNEAGFKDGDLFRDQSKDKVVKYCRAARKKVVYLRRFKGDWATTTYLHRSFSNRRAYLGRQKGDGLDLADDNGEGLSGTRDTDSVSGDDDDDLGKEDDQDDFPGDSDEENGFCDD